jgi:hypothetical protein
MGVSRCCTCMCLRRHKAESYRRMVTKLKKNIKKSTLIKLETLSQDTSRRREMQRESSFRTPGLQRGISNKKQDYYRLEKKVRSFRFLELVDEEWWGEVYVRCTTRYRLARRLVVSQGDSGRGGEPKEHWPYLKLDPSRPATRGHWNALHSKL